MTASPAAAQLAANVAIDSDYRLRGYLLSNDHPAFSVQVSYDHPSGAYASLFGLTEIGSDARFLGIVGNVGYAKRVGSHLTLDAGVLRSQIRSAVPGVTGFNYTEVYAGAYVGPVAGHIYYSPDYRTGSQSTLYGEIEAGFEPIPKWRLSAHAGVTTYLSSSPFYRAGNSRLDCRVSVARQLGRFELHASLSRGVSNRYYDDAFQRKTALAVGASFSF